LGPSEIRLSPCQSTLVFHRWINFERLRYAKCRINLRWISSSVETLGSSLPHAAPSSGSAGRYGTSPPPPTPPACTRLWLPDELGEARHRRGRPSAARRRGPRARWLGPIVLPSAIASSAGQRQAARSSSQPLPSYRLREVSRSSYPHLRFFFLPPPVHHGFLICSLHAPHRACFLGAEGVGFRGAAVSLRRTCGWDQRRGVGPAAELCRHIHDDGGKAARCRPTHPGHLQHQPL